MSRWGDPDYDDTLYVDLCTPDDPDDYDEEVTDEHADNATPE